ncbi:MAG: hypothetical protein WCA38_02360 [Candidatus Acidiferrales bacterium]
MTDDQLKESANLAYSLTEPAKAALTAELLHRNLNIPVAQAAPATPEGEDDRLVTLRTFFSVQEALLAKGVLDSTGIPSLLADENITRIAGFLLGPREGVKPQVRQIDAATAAELLDQTP